MYDNADEVVAWIRRYREELRRDKPWSIVKSNYRFIPWYTGLKVVV